MKKNILYKIWKSDYNISDFLISKLLCYKLNITTKELFLMEDIDDKLDILNDFDKLSKNYPIEYLLNNAEFYWLNFYVDNRVLIPRNDTEVMVKNILKTINHNINYTLIDVWTWTSCIPISVLKNSNNFTNWYVLDLSSEALEVSKINLKNNNLEDKIKQFKSDLLNQLFVSNLYLEKNLIISSNLPYIKNNDFENMDEEVILYEPKIALYWWEKTWFELYEKLLDQIFEFKKQFKLEKIFVFFEIWFDQYEYSKKYLEQKWLKFEYFKDMNNIYRVIKINI